MGDVTGKVLPKFALVASPAGDGTITGRYFVPWNCHSAFAVTGALCLGAAASIPGTVAHRVARHDPANPGVVVVEHPAGKLETRMSIRKVEGSAVPEFDRAGIVRTARPLLIGVVHIADDVWRRPAHRPGGVGGYPVTTRLEKP
jgi:4-oxalomesaconate tautomerase